jgi:hypothetical protein
MSLCLVSLACTCTAQQAILECPKIVSRASKIVAYLGRVRRSIKGIKCPMVRTIHEVQHMGEEENDSILTRELFS